MSGSTKEKGKEKEKVEEACERKRTRVAFDYAERGKFWCLSLRCFKRKTDADFFRIQSDM